MEEAILKILNKKVEYTINRYPAKSTTTEAQPIKSVGVDYDKASKEIADTFERFIQWIGLEYGFNNLAIREIDMKWIYPIEPVAFSEELTLSELFTYWNTNFNK